MTCLACFGCCAGRHTFVGDDLDEHGAEAVGAGVAGGQQAQQQQTGTAAQETLLLLGPTQARVQTERTHQLLLSAERERGG